MKVIGIGDNVCDKYVHLKTMFPGGQALNFAVYAKLLGADAAYMGVFGRDEVADHILATLDQLQVDHSRCRQYDGENGFASVTLVEGDRVFLGSNRGGVAKEHPLELTEADADYIRGFGHVHTSMNSYFNSQLPKVKEAGVSLSYDYSGRWRDEALVAQTAPYVDYAFLSCGGSSLEETREICRGVYAAGCGRVIATRGGSGALCYDGVGFYEQAPETVEAVDTLGAGDSFATAFLLSFLEQLEAVGEKMTEDSAFYEKVLRTALQKGAAFAAKTCLVQGAFGHGKPFLPE